GPGGKGPHPARPQGRRCAAGCPEESQSRPAPVRGRGDQGVESSHRPDDRRPCPTDRTEGRHALCECGQQCLVGRDCPLSPQGDTHKASTQLRARPHCAHFLPRGLVLESFTKRIKAQKTGISGSKLANIWLICEEYVRQIGDSVADSRANDAGWLAALPDPAAQPCGT